MTKEPYKLVMEGPPSLSALKGVHCVVTPIEECFFIPSVAKSESMGIGLAHGRPLIRIAYLF